jgi:dihydrofolate reductase
VGPGRIQLYTAVSIDGFIAPVDGSTDWLDDTFDVDYGYAEFFSGISTVVLGRITYEQILTLTDVWPYGEKRSIVLTSTMPLSNDPNTNVEFRPLDKLDDLCRELCADGNVWLVGGGLTNKAFLQRDLIDDYMLFIVPKLLGGGRPLFGTDVTLPAGSMQLAVTKAYENGTVMNHYIRTTVEA